MASPWFPTCSELQISLCVRNFHTCPLLLRRHWFVAAVEMYWCFAFSFALQLSSFWSTGSTKYRVSAFTEVDEHLFSNLVPLSIWFVRMCSVPLFFLIQAKETTNDRARIFFHIICYNFGIRNTQLFVSFLFRHNVIVHRHEDNPSSELLWQTLCFSHHDLNLVEARIDSINSLLSGEFWNQLILSFQACTTVADFSHTQHWVREYVGLRGHYLDCPVCQQSCPLPRLVFPVSHKKYLGFLSWSLINFCVTLKSCFNVRLDWFMVERHRFQDELQLEEWRSWIFPISTRSSNFFRENFFKMRYVSGGYVEIVRPPCRYRRWFLNLSPRVLQVSLCSADFQEMLMDFGSILKLRVSSCFRPIVHLFATLENSTLRHTDLNLSPRVSQCFLRDQASLTWCSEYPRTVGCIWTRHSWRTFFSHRYQDRRFRLCHNSFFSVFLLHPFRHYFWAAVRAEILKAANWSEMADVTQIKKVVPFMKWLT